MREYIKIQKYQYPGTLNYTVGKTKKILISTSPTYLKAVKEVEKYIDFFKVASPQSTGFSQIIDEIIKTKKVYSFNRIL